MAWIVCDISEVEEGQKVRLNYSRPADRDPDPDKGEFVVGNSLVTPNRVGVADKDAWQAKKSKDGPDVWTLAVETAAGFRTFLGTRLVDAAGNSTSEVEIEVE